MLLVIFGAGASYDSVPHLPPPEAILRAIRPFIPENDLENFRPPLANQLFDTRPIFVNLMNRFPECKEVVPLLRKSGIVVERELAKLIDQGTEFPLAHQELNAIRF